MDLPEQPTAEHYIRGVARLRVPVNITFDDRAHLTNCRLVCEGEDEEILLARVEPGNYPSTGKVTITCAYGKALYIFKTRIIGQKHGDGRHLFLKLEFPGEFAKEERRKFIRVTPSNLHPVRLKFAVPGHGIVSHEASDISGGGLSFVLPQSLAKLKVGNSFHVTITLPMFGELDAWITVMSISHLFNMVRVGTVFSIVSDSAHSFIMSYVASRDREARSETRKRAPVVSYGKGRICLVEKGRHQDKYAFLENIFSVIKTESVNAVSTLKSNRPDLIILSDSSPYSLKPLETISKHRTLKRIPIIVLTEKERNNPAIPKYAVIINGPYHQQLLVKTAEDLIEEYRLNEKIQVKPLRTVTNRTNKVFIIDRFGNFSKENINTLVDYGFEVKVNRKEEDVATKAQHFHPDIILIDEEMESIDPVSLCQSMSSHESLKDVPRIILISSQKDFHKFYSQGHFAGFLTKPVNIELLISKVFQTVPQTTGKS